MPPVLIALTCPVCGAPLPEEPQRCTFCGATLAIAMDIPRIDPRSLNRAVINERIQEFRRRVRRDGHDEMAHYGLGIAYLTLGLIEDAARELTEAARLMPENPHIQHQLAACWLALGAKGELLCYDRAAVAIEKAALLQPDDLDTTILRAEIDLRRQQHTDAIRWLRSALAGGAPYDRIRQPLNRSLLAHAGQLADAPYPLRRQWLANDSREPSRPRAWRDLLGAIGGVTLFLMIAPRIEAIPDGVVLACWLLLGIPAIMLAIRRLISVSRRADRSRSRRIARIQRDLSAGSWSRSACESAADYLLGRRAATDAAPATVTPRGVAQAVR